MYDFLKLHHDCDAYMGVQKEQKITVLAAFNNNNDILLRTHGPYHKHKNTKSG